MGKREKKIQVMKQWLDRCTTTWDTYAYGNIPKSIYQGACTYAGTVRYEDVLGIIDETVFGSAKKGILFAQNGWYSSETKKCILYSDLRSINNRAGYNCTAFNEVLEKLYDIETEPSGWDIAAGLFDVLLESLDEYTEKQQIQDENVRFLEEDDEYYTVADLESLRDELQRFIFLITALEEKDVDDILTIVDEEIGEEEREICEIMQNEEVVEGWMELYATLNIADLEEMLDAADQEDMETLEEIKIQVEQINYVLDKINQILD